MIETKKGKVTDIQKHVDVSGGHSGIFVQTRHITHFHLNHTPVIVMSQKPLLIQAGDTVVVSGTLDNGALTAYAYKNITTSFSENLGYRKRFFAAVIFLFAGYYFWFILAPDTSETAKIVALLFTGLGFYFLYRGRQILKAVNHVVSTR